MNDERSPAIERLFIAADRDLADEAFVGSVMAKTKWSARTLLLALAVCLVAAPIAWLLMEPLTAAFLWVTQVFSRPVMGDGEGIAGTVLPMNTVGGVLALSLVVLRTIAKRLFGENN